MAVLYEVGGAGGHTMTPTPAATVKESDVVTAVNSATATNDNVASLYGIQQWSNTECINILTEPTADYDVVGTWEESPTDWKTSGVRTGWIMHEALAGIIGDNTVELQVINDIDHETVASLYAYRVDDEIYQAVTTSAGDNPSENGWYELSGSTYVATTDTSVQSGKTYYKKVGGVAIKLNNKLPAHTKIGVRLVRQRTQTFYV